MWGLLTIQTVVVAVVDDEPWGDADADGVQGHVLYHAGRYWLRSVCVHMS